MKISQIYSKKLKKTDNRGAAIVMTIVAIAIISVLAILALWIAYMNYYMKVTDMNSTDNFYTAEGVVEQIRIGLQTELSDASGRAYRNVMQKYALLDDTAKKNQFFAEVENQLISNLKNATVATNDVYDMSRLCRYINSTETAASFDSNKNQGSYTLNMNAAGDIAIVSVSDGTNTANADNAFMELDTTNHIMTLRNVNVEYQNASGYVSVINTDFTLKVPIINFGVPLTDADFNVFEYCVIADDNLVAQTASASTLKGSVYGGNGSETAGDEEPQGSSHTVFADCGIVSLPQSKMNFSTGGDYVISGKAMKQHLSSEVTVGSPDGGAGVVPDKELELWAQDIVLGGSTKTDNNVKLDLAQYVNTYVRDDMSIDGQNSNVTIAGDYYGYGTGLGMTGDEGDGSSAILINGKNTTLDLSQSHAMLIAGHSYIGTKDATLPSGMTEPNPDIPMGDSIGVRGNQLAYLVPVNAMPAEVKSNPVSKAAYEAFLDGYTEADNWGVNMAASIGVKDDSGVDLPLSHYNCTIQKVFAQGLGGNYLVYYYMVMGDREMAQDFFERYYQVDKNKVSLEKYLGRYVTRDMQVADWTNIVMKGNALVRTDDGTNLDVNGKSIVASEIRQSTPDILDNADYKKVPEWESKFRCLVNNIDPGTMGSYDRVFDNIIDTERVDQFFADGTGTKVFKGDDPTSSFWGVVARGEDYHYTGDSHIRCIICTNDIYIESNFKGTAIAGGKIYVSGTDRKIETDDDIRKEAVQVMNNKMTVGGTLWYYKEFFRNYVDDTSEETLEEPETDLNKLVNYENWTKR